MRKNIPNKLVKNIVNHLINETNCDQIQYIKYTTLLYITNTFLKEGRLLNLNEFNKIMLIVEKIYKNGIWRDYDHRFFHNN